MENRPGAAADPGPVLRFENISKGYQALRPLRLASLEILPRERVALSGLDAPGAEVLVNLITGATLPDQGQVWTFGRRTADISNADEWFTWLDSFGIVSERGVLLEGASVQQNLALPFSLEIDPIPGEVMARVAELARECGLPEQLWNAPTSDLSADARLRVHLARAVALSPRLLLIEHPTGRVPEDTRPALAIDIARVCQQRALTALIITNDSAFAQAVATRNLKLERGTGEIRAVKKGWMRW